MDKKNRNVALIALSGIHSFCPTRWTVKADSLESILSNYCLLQSTFNTAKDLSTDVEIKTRLIGVLTQMQNFEFYFGIVLAELFLKHGDNLSRTLQNPNLSAAEGQEVARLTVATLQSVRNERDFDLFWCKVLKNNIEKLDVNEHSLPRQRKVPRRFEIGESEPSFSSTPKQYYRRVYYEALDLVTNAITDRFNQPGFRVYRKTQDLLLKAVHGSDYKEDFEFVVNFYGDVFNASQLEVQLQYC